jgi:excisionase family DNA binding protein
MQATTLNSTDAQLAQNASHQLAALPTSQLELHAPNGQRIAIPANAIPAIQSVLEQLGKQASVVVLSIETDVSTLEAADILDISRPHFKKLLDNGEIPFRMVGSHRRMKLSDVIQYQTQQNQRSLKAMVDLMAQAQEFKLGY